MRATCTAIFRACASLSMTQGPAIRNSGFAPPRRSEPTAISRVLSMRRNEDSTKRVVGPLRRLDNGPAQPSEVGANLNALGDPGGDAGAVDGGTRAAS